MSTNYSAFKEKIDQIKEKIDMCTKMLEEVKSEEKNKYENPRYRIWSGDIKDLEGFALRLEEWLNQPPVAEAKRYLLDLKRWSESPEKISLEEIEKDWRFLSDNLEEIKSVHEQTRDITYERIKKKILMWILNRIIEKDIEKAKIWAVNAHKFTDRLNQLENKKTESRLADEVKKNAVDELLKATSFDKDNEEAVSQYQELIEEAENIVKNKPAEISDESIFSTYDKSMKISETLSMINTELGNIRAFLITLEWVQEFPNVKDYNKLWTGKKAATGKKDLTSIGKTLENVQKQAELWKDARRREIESALVRIGRMSRGAENEDISKSIVALEEEKQGIDWNKPDLKTLSDIISQSNDLKKLLRAEFLRKLQNEDAILIIEEPEIIEDFGKRVNWDFERFFKALGIVLHNGLIEIKAVEEK